MLPRFLIRVESLVVFRRNYRRGCVLCTTGQERVRDGSPKGGDALARQPGRALARGDAQNSLKRQYGTWGTVLSQNFLQRSDMVAETMLGRCEHSSAISSNTTARTLREILSLPVTYGLDGKLPESLVEQAELEIVNRRANSGCLTQRYVKRHGLTQKSAETGRFCGFCSPNSRLLFWDGFWGWNANRIPELFIGEVVLSKQVDVPP